MQNESKKDELILDIQNLLNSYRGVETTVINPKMLEFMQEDDLKSIINSLLNQKEDLQKNSDIEWLEKFKKQIN